MARMNAPLVTFNRGRISKLALARVDLDRTRLSAEIQTNWVPRNLGSMMLRPGLQYIATVRGSTKVRLIPFIFGTTDTALFEVASTALRIFVQDTVISRTLAGVTVTNGDFSSSNTLVDWTDADQSGASSTHITGDFMELIGNRYARAIRRQSVEASTGTRGLTTVVNRGHVNIRVGSSVGGDNYIKERELKVGTYSFLFTNDSTDFHIELSGNTEYSSRVASITIDATGDLILPLSWSSSDLDYLRWDQSADVLFVADNAFRQKRIERHGTNSWAVADYDPEDGPFRAINITNKNLTPSALSGDITLECDQPLFNSDHVGALFRITSVGQKVSADINAAGQYSDTIRISGVGQSRSFSFLVSSGTGWVQSSDTNYDMQRSIGTTSNFAKVEGLQWNTTFDSTYNDGLDNQITYYRIGCLSHSAAASTTTLSITYAGGGISGVVKIRAVTGATESSASVLMALGSTTPSELWEESDWSTFRGFPSAVAFHEGRLGWAGRGKIQLSESDSFEGWSPGTEGDAGSINRTVASDGSDRIPWIASLGRLIVGTQTRELQVKTGALDEPITPSNFNLRDASQQGSANVQAVIIDQRALFIQQGGVRVMDVGPGVDSLKYETADRTVLVPEMGEPSFIRMAVQRQPDTRVHCVRSDGTVGMLVSDPAENVQAWLDIETGDADGVNGVIEEVAVLPTSDREDAVYYIVKREINGSTVRYIERMAREDQAHGGADNRISDSFLVQNTVSATDVITSLDHLEGSTSAIIWGATADLGIGTVATNAVTASQASTTFIVGLPYSAKYRSAKLAYAAEAGTALTQVKKVNHVGLVLADVHAQGIRFGPSTDRLDNLPLVSSGSTISTDGLNATFDEQSIPFDGNWNTDSRIVLIGTAPRPVTVLGAVIQIDTKEKT